MFRVMEPKGDEACLVSCSKNTAIVQKMLLCHNDRPFTMRHRVLLLLIEFGLSSCSVQRFLTFSVIAKRLLTLSERSLSFVFQHVQSSLSHSFQQLTESDRGPTRVVSDGLQNHLGWSKARDLIPQLEREYTAQLVLTSIKISLSSGWERWAVLT